VAAVTDDEVKRSGRLAYREAGPDGAESGAPVLLVHGFPETSYMWRDYLPAIAAAGRRAIAPDLIGYGASEPDPPATWERHVEALGELVAGLELERVVLVVHDWGGLIGLRWACDDPDRIAALVISGTGFFPDGKWHGMAEGLRTEGQGEQMVEALDRAAFGQLLAASGTGFDERTVDEYFRAFSTPERKAGILEMYRSGDFSKLAPYEGGLAALGVPTLLLWGEDDEFAPVAGAHRLQRDIPGAELELIGGAGHFVWADAPAACRDRLLRFIDEQP
jgi:haloalkane dehalogenase